MSAALDLGKLLAARRAAVSACPYLATALHAMTVVPSAGVPTMGVDRYWRCYVSPSFVAMHDVPELAWVWLHEVAHLVRGHHGRADALRQASLRHRLAPGTPALDPARPRREQLRLNLAMDCEINDDLPEVFGAADAGPGALAPRRPGDVVTPESLRIATCELFEQYVRQLPLEALDGCPGCPGWTAVPARTAAPRTGNWARTGRTRSASTRPPRSASRSARPSRAAGAPRPRAGSAGPKGPPSRRRTGAPCSPGRCAPAWPPRARAPATTPTGGRAGGPRRSAARSSCPACAGRCRRSPS